MLKSWSFAILFISIIVSSSLLTLSALSGTLSSQSPNSWQGIGEGSISTLKVAPRIVSVSFDKKSITPGDWVTVTIKATNDGPDAVPLQTLHVGLPFDPPSADIQIVSTDLSGGAKIYYKGDTIWIPGVGAKPAKYPIVEGWQENFSPGTVRTLQIKVKFPDADTVTFDVKTVACDKNWNVIARFPSSGMIDQQGEYVKPYLILRKFSVAIAPTGSLEVDVKITNHNRQPYVGTQPSMSVDSFSVTNYGGMDASKVSISASNLGLVIGPGESKVLKIKITTSGHPIGTFTIEYSVSGSP